MPIHLTLDQAAGWGAKKWLSYQDPQMTVRRKEQILPVTKYNMVVNTFNASTVVLVVALVAAMFFAYSAALVLGSIALFTHFTTKKEILSYDVRRGGEGPQQPKEIRLAIAEEWHQCEVLVFDHPVWMNKAPLPEDPDRYPHRFVEADAEGVDN